MPKRETLNQIQSNQIDSTRNQFQKFKNSSFRKYQKETIQQAIESTKPIVCIQAPTGSGKSLIGMISGAMYGEFCYIVSSKQLQDQIEQDYPEIKILKGRNNYKCKSRPSKMCDECIHTKMMPCNHYISCNYRMQKKIVLNARYKVINYHYFLYEANYIGQFTDFPIIIADEADLIEELITEFVSIKISHRQLAQLDIPLIPNKTTKAKNGVENWKDWGEVALSKTNQELSKIVDILNNDELNTQTSEQLNKKSKQLFNLSTKFEIFINNVNEDWILEETKQKFNTYYTFKPIWLTEQLSSQFFFKHAKKFILMSATFPPIQILSKLLAQPVGHLNFIDVPSTFPVSNRPIILSPVANITHKTFEIEVPKLIAEIHNILSRHVLEKGIIHAVSYKLTQLIMGMGLSRLITHNSSNKQHMIDHFRSSTGNLVIVSPSCERGVDLPGDECAFQIWAKAPFKSLGDKLTKSRVYSSKFGNYWYKSLTAQTVIQGTGRGVRSKKDKCVTYILDEQIVNLVCDHKGLFPKYWIEAVDI